MSKPKIRFKGYEEDWEQRKLGDIAEFSKGSGYSKGDLIESGTPIILYGRLYTKYETSISEVDTYVEAKDGSVYSKGGEVIVPASGETAEDIARAATVDKSGVILGGDLNVVSPNEDINSAFLAISISHGNSQRELAKKAQGKSIVHIHNEEIKNLVVPFPTKAEQNKIVEYFSSLDNLITLHQRKCEETKKLKKYMLQKMFPQNGKRVPEIRFVGFTEDWEQRKLGDVLEEFSNKSTVEDEYTVLSSTNTGMEFRDGRVSGTSNLGYKIIEIDDLVLSPQNLWLGNININNLEKGLVSPSYKTFKLRNIDKEFFRPQLRTKKMLELYKQASVQGASVVRRNLDMDLFEQIELNIPMIEEQAKIGEYFFNLDYLITLHQRKYEELQKIKKFMLQNMFI